ncbi:hypothetical protein BT63DRAFT_15455 [Microthyrium microscopicum]|uniref:Exosome complex protein n=1 Tax=Microthyrium microscopicum TaxID=703497 RepID=A0A6A6UUI9_9PEZI|nr:hypothetical protein BT63DRAFT_15455 [Microthyrium microscopicum]
MDTSTVQTALTTLTSDIDALTTALQPLLSEPTNSLASPLPLLDKAKLYTTSTYAIESLLFSALRLSGADAKAHPVFAELARVKAYFDKVKEAEHPEMKPRIDKEAAGRFVKAGLAGNTKRKFEDGDEGVARGKEDGLGKKSKLRKQKSE